MDTHSRKLKNSCRQFGEDACVRGASACVHAAEHGHMQAHRRIRPSVGASMHTAERVWALACVRARTCADVLVR
eukprot:670455-Pleurochrysis_carterae.AAC.1